MDQPDEKIKPTFEKDRSWSVWTRTALARRYGQFYGKNEVKSAEGGVIMRQWWLGPIGFGWVMTMSPGKKPE